MAGNHTRARLQTCLPALVGSCLNSRLHVQKAIRFPLYMLGSLWDIMSEVKVIHYVRDPRGMFLSRAPFLLHKRALMGLNEKDRANSLAVAGRMCERMRDDLKWGDVYASSHSEHFLKIRYEDLAEHTTDVVRTIYDFLGLQLPSSTPNRVLRLTSAENDGNIFSTFRKNSTMTARAWRHKIPKSFHEALVRTCGDVIHMLGYDVQM